MVEIQVIRLQSSDSGTFGNIVINGKKFCFSGELPWRKNESNISCIPVGDYRCRYTVSPGLHRSTYEVFGVPGRAGIRIHSANYVGDQSKGLRCQAQGCIILGEKIGILDGQQALLISRPAVSKFEAYLERKPIFLKVRNAWE